MSMLCWLLGLSPAQVHALRATPSLAGDLAQVAEDGQQAANLSETMKRLLPEQRTMAEAQHRARLAAIGPMPGYEEAHARVRRLGSLESALDLQKAWHILHFLFTGHVDAADAPGDALLSGEPLGEDVGYGPARLHGPEATLAFDRFLTTLDVERLQARVSIVEMRRLNIYSLPMGPGSDAEYDRELREEVGHAFLKLRDYVSDKSAKGDGLLIWLS